MIWIILLLVVVVVCIMAYLKNKKSILVLPYLLILFITPIYSILDRMIFIKIFGCGCVPYTQTNVLNISFNANDLRAVVYTAFVFLALIIGIFLSRKVETKISKVIYMITILVFNVLLAYIICILSMWA